MKNIPARLKGKILDLMRTVWSLGSLDTTVFFFSSFSINKLNLCFCALLKFGGPSGLTLTWWRCCGLCQRHKPTEPAHSFYSALVSISVLLVLSTVFHSINYPDNSLLSHSVLPVLILPYWAFQLYVSLRKSSSTLI